MSVRGTILLVVLLGLAGLAGAQEAGNTAASQPTSAAASAPASQAVGGVVGELLESQNAGRTVTWVGLITVLSLVPALAVMVTSFTRIVVVLGLLRQALAVPNLPPNQVLFGLAVLMTVVVMAPVFGAVWADAVQPWMNGEASAEEAFQSGQRSLRAFMIRQLQSGGNTGSVSVFLPADVAGKAELTWADVPTVSLIPAFVLGELKIAFQIGLRIFLPFVLIDMLVGSVLVSMGMLMLPPVLVSMPLKLVLFVMADGWTLVAGTVMKSFS